MHQQRNTVALVIPLYNEEEMIPILLKELEFFRESNPEIKEIVFINDGSKDKTLSLIKELFSDKTGYKLVDFSRNFGHQIAVTAGLDFVESDAAVIIDADLQDPLEVVKEMILKWKDGFDVVYGIRKNREGESLFKKATAKLFYRFFRWITDLDIPMDTGAVSYTHLYYFFYTQQTKCYFFEGIQFNGAGNFGIKRRKAECRFVFIYI